MGSVSANCGVVDLGRGTRVAFGIKTMTWLKMEVMEEERVVVVRVWVESNGNKHVKDRLVRRCQSKGKWLEFELRSR